MKDENDIDALLATELNQLSIQERENVFEEIHGVDQVVNESEAMIRKRLQELEFELDQIPHKPAYDLAINKGASERDFVTSRKFRLRFLRTDNFDVKKAAKRIVKYMEGMLKYFGPTVLGRPLYFSDLRTDSQKYVETGVYQLVHSARDSVGRAVFMDHHLKAELYYEETQTLIQTFLYLFYCATEGDETTQRKGIVLVSYIIGKIEGEFKHKAHIELNQIQTWFPMKVQALHVCFDDPRVRAFAPLAWIAMGPRLRQRVRIHYGTHTECMYSLMSFGIPVSSLPVTDKGSIKTNAHQKWMAQRQAKESTMQSSQQPLEAIIETPATNDVVLWRGRVYQQHPGNLLMRSLLEQYRDEYESTKKGGARKGQVAMKIIKTIQTEHGGRFLTQDPSGGGWWVQVSDKEAERKVCKAFRSARASTTSTETTAASTKQVIPRLHHDNKRLRVTSPAGGSASSCCSPEVNTTSAACFSDCPGLLPSPRNNHSDMIRW